jgi:hypothetical protein
MAQSLTTQSLTTQSLTTQSLTTQSLNPEAFSNAYCSTHFLSKFNNQGKDERLSKYFTKSEKQHILSVSKKHSGSLWMGPCPYSKNSTCNRYSRLGLRVLRDYMCAVFGEPIDNPITFSAFWSESEKQGLCYSFELVVPRLLGDHGDIPKNAYLVLTTIASTKGIDRFLSPSEVLELAIKWRLPLNQSWYFNADVAPIVEDAIHTNRWTLADSDVDSILSKFGGIYQGFLTHYETQGDVLEGFVLMAIEVTNMDKLVALIARYNDTMAPWHDAAMAAFDAIAIDCIANESALMTDIDMPSGNVKVCDQESGELFLAPEPKRIEMKEDDIWELVLKYGTGSICQTFHVLNRSYRNKITLKAYTYVQLSDIKSPEGKEKIQVIVEVHDDEVFYSAPAHHILLFRGMIVQFNGRDIEPQVGYVQPSDTPQLKILAIGKLKCLNYLWRTFGVRNQLDSLLTSQDTYISRISNFFKNWDVPEQYQHALTMLFKAWAKYVYTLSSKERTELGKHNTYLTYLTIFLASNNQELIAASQFLSGIGPITAELGSISEARVQTVLPFVMVVSKTQLSAEMIELFSAYNRVVAKGDNFKPGYYTIVPQPVTLSKNIDVSLVVIINIENSIHDKWPGWKIIPVTNDPTIEEMVILLMPRQLELSASIEQKPVLPIVTIVGILALIPGGGKSTFMKHLNSTTKSTIVSSDDCKKRQKIFDNEFKASIRMAAKTGGGIIGYDKNIPNDEGLSKLIKIIRDMSNICELRLAFIAPANIDRERCWARVAIRDASYGLTPANMDPIECEKVFDNFYLMASTWLPIAQQLPNVVITSAFFDSDGEANLPTIIHRALENTISLDELIIASTSGGTTNKTNTSLTWVSATIIGPSNLHMTIVPPPGSRCGTEEIERNTILSHIIWSGISEQHIQLHVSRYFKFTSGEGRKQMQVCFWTIDRVDGLADEFHLSSQRPYYHITDVGALFNTKPKDSYDLYKKMLESENGFVDGWTIELLTYPTPIVFTGIIHIM